MPDITIVTTRSSPRLQYIVHHIFDQFLGIRSHIAQSIPSDNSPFILYGGDLNTQKGISIPSHKLLFEPGVNNNHIEVRNHEGFQKAMIVDQSKEMTLDFDLFAWLFYLLSRYEEYQSEDLDDHGRYKSRNSLAVKHGFIELPIVDIWIRKLTEEIKTTFGIDYWPHENGKVIPSIDIDMPYAYHKKGAKAYLGIFRDLLAGNIGGIHDRFTYLRTGKDPFDKYEEIEKLLNPNSSAFIFLLQNYNPPHDLNHLVDQKEWKNIVRNLSKWATLGIHPSYESHKDTTKLESEKEALESLIGRVTHSRQHFLKFTLPKTYHNLISMDIEHDHSMLYPDRVGFRASTSRPFLWYDLKKEEATNLLIHPYVVMDVTLRYYMNLNPNQSIKKIKEIEKTLQAVNGNLGFLWHNSSMSRAYGWKQWMPVLNHMTNSSLRSRSDTLSE